MTNGKPLTEYQNGTAAVPPLNQRLRAEAGNWDENEPVIGLLLEAADAIETLVAAVAIQTALAKPSQIRAGEQPSDSYA